MTIHPSPTVRVATNDDFAAVESFYRDVGYSPVVDRANKLLLAEVDGRIVGVLRLCEEYGALVLRGMQVEPGWRRKGVGTGLLGVAIAHMDRDCFLSFVRAHRRILSPCGVCTGGRNRCAPFPA